MTKKITALLMSVALMASCSNKQTYSDIIPVNEATKVQINLSDYVSSLEYIPLETTDECLIDRNPSFYVLDDYIIVSTSQQCFLFNRNGKFIREIGRVGRGPDEYRFAGRGEVIDEQNKTVLMQGWDKWLEYSFNGMVIRTYPIVPQTTATTYVSDGVLVQGVYNFSGNAVNQLVFTNQEGIFDSIPNHQFFTPFDLSAFGGMGVEFNFYRYRDGLYYKNLYNDTIFQIKDRQLHSTRIFDMGRYHLPRAVMANMNTFRQEARKYNMTQNILEADPFLLFSIFSERGDSAYIFDKHKNQVFVMQKEQGLKGFFNDIDGGMPFWPAHINRKQELVSFLYPFEMIEMLTIEYFERKNIRDEAANLRLKELIRRLNEEDNPVVVIGRLK